MNFCMFYLQVCVLCVFSSWLSNNQIHTIERGAFQDLVGVEKLRLNNNQIRHLPDLLFSNMMNLKRLWVFQKKVFCMEYENGLLYSSKV